MIYPGAQSSRTFWNCNCKKAEVFYYQILKNPICDLITNLNVSQKMLTWGWASFLTTDDRTRSQAIVRNFYTFVKNNINIKNKGD
jgi:hypothetical protein